MIKMVATADGRGETHGSELVNQTQLDSHSIFLLLCLAFEFLKIIMFNVWIVLYSQNPLSAENVTYKKKRFGTKHSKQ